MQRLALLAAWLVGPALANADTPIRVESAIHWESTVENRSTGPIALARSLNAELARPATGGVKLSIDVSSTLRLDRAVALVGTARLAHQIPREGHSHDASRINEAYLDIGQDEWRLVAGQKVVAWDVGYAFRPNDVIQHERRRALVPEPLEGRTLLHVERVRGDQALGVVWLPHETTSDAAQADREAREGAIVAHGYRRLDALDLYGYARHGRDTGTGVGLAAAWVPTEALELHASWRGMRRHYGWTSDGSAGLAMANPWRQDLRGGAAEWLVGGQWTLAEHLNLIVELWHDGTAPSDSAWRSWRQRTDSLLTLLESGAPIQPVAANLAWQATPLQGTSLRRRNVFVRAAWQEGTLSTAVEAQGMPADTGRIVTLSLQWQGDRTSLRLAARIYGGPQSALAAQLPVRSALAVLFTAAL